MKFSDSLGGIWEMLMCENMCVSVITLFGDVEEVGSGENKFRLARAGLGFCKEKKKKKKAN